MALKNNALLRELEAAIRARREMEQAEVAALPMDFGQTAPGAWAAVDRALGEDEWSRVHRARSPWDEAVAKVRGYAPQIEGAGAAQEKDPMNVNTLKVLVQKLDQVSDLDEVVMGLAAAKGLRAGYADAGLPIPEWIEDARDALEVEVKRRSADELKRQKKALEAELEGLKSREEKRAEKERKLAAINERLGGARAAEAAAPKA